jgi:predicted GNAT family acetyltransferase
MTDVTTELRRITPDDWELLRDIRLRALADSPDAFGSTLEREASGDESEWRRRASGPLLVVMEGDRAMSMAGTFTDEVGVHVWGMWTDPAHRGKGYGRAILDGLLGEARAAGLLVQLHVNIANPVARTVYERYGFVGTGVLEPLRPGSEQRIELMELQG